MSCWSVAWWDLYEEKTVVRKRRVWPNCMQHQKYHTQFWHHVRKQLPNVLWHGLHIWGLRRPVCLLWHVICFLWHLKSCWLPAGGRTIPGELLSPHFPTNQHRWWRCHKKAAAGGLVCFLSISLTLSVSLSCVHFERPCLPVDKMTEWN